MELETTKKENSVTEVLKTEFEALRSDKEQKSKETANLLFKIEKYFYVPTHILRFTLN